MKRRILRLIPVFISLAFVLQLTAQNDAAEQFTYLSPRPEAQFANVEHTLAFRQGDVLDATSLLSSQLIVTGSESGVHSGALALSSDGRTLIFNPDQPFYYDETVTVEVLEGFRTANGKTIEPMSYSFRTEKQDNRMLNQQFLEHVRKEMNSRNSPSIASKSFPVSGFKSSAPVPEGFPELIVTQYNNPAPGYLFVNPHNAFHPLAEPAYSVIMDHYGTPVWYILNNTHSLDLKIQETGHVSQFLAESTAGLGIGYGINVIYDSHMNPLDTFQMGNGYLAEMHDFQYFNDGSCLMFTYDGQIIDMSQIVEGGDPAATVMGFVLQELDESKNVVFEWSSWDHMSITDATPDVDLTGVFIDYCHGNSVERDNDGNILVSFRNTDEIIKINRETGEILWRMNAFYDELNDITFLNDTIKFSHQHDARRQENGNITIFDNGNMHWGPYSRILEYSVDEENKTAELVYVYPPQPDTNHHFAFATGGAHRQPGGNTTVGWGLQFPVPDTALIIGEVTPEAESVYQVLGTDSITTYRAHKFMWETDLFTTSKDTIDWGEFTGYTPAPYILQVTNNSEATITLSGTHNRTQEYSVISSFPMDVEPGSTSNITINFFPSTDGYFEDVLTVMCSKSEHEMIGKQVVMTGYTEDQSAPLATFYPEDNAAEIDLMPTLKLTFNEKLYINGGEPLTNADLAGLLMLDKYEKGGESVDFKAWLSWYSTEKTEIMVQPFDYLEANTTYAWGVMGNMVHDWNGNVIESDLTASFTTGDEMSVEDILVNDFARVFPNPTSGVLSLEFKNNDRKSVRIFDANGEEVLRADNLMGMNYTFDISDQSKGIFIVQVINHKTDQSVELKIIKN